MAVTAALHRHVDAVDFSAGGDIDDRQQRLVHGYGEGLFVCAEPIAPRRDVAEHESPFCVGERFRRISWW